ncbi:MAG: 3-hydroxyacyl-CoA dehydrogenase NAD-binding domain-containing protein, partial [Spirochaetia bacterium]
IAWLFTHKDIPVRMKDINWKALATGFKTIHETNQKIISKKKIEPKEAARQENLATGTTDYSGFASLPFVIEAIIEKPGLKKKVYGELEEFLPRDAVVATNTSSLTVDGLAGGFKHPERFVGMHFFNPPSRMPLVEVVSGPKSKDWAVAAAVKTAKQLGKVPVVVGDCPGFLVNRLLMPYLNEAAYLAGEGVGIKKIDKVMKDFGWPMGPFKLMDMIGIDIGFEVAKVLAEAYGKRMEVSPLFSRIGKEEKLLGEKSGEGFYLYGKKGEGLNPRITELLEGVTDSKDKKGMPKEDTAAESVRMRLMLPMLFEAVRALNEEIASSSDDVDMALILGTGFPPFRGGLFRWANTLGSGPFLEHAERIRKNQRAGGSAEVRFAPPEGFAERIDSSGG